MLWWACLNPLACRLVGISMPAMSSQRIVFMGTGDIALPAFSSLLGKNLVGLVTQPDKPVGRKQTLTAPRIKTLALEHGIPVYQPERVSDSDWVESIRELQADVVVVMAYGQILSQELLELPRLACINLHASLLPKYRGAACIQAAIDAGDAETGITVMHMVKALDAGDIILKKRLLIDPADTGGVLHDRLAELAPEAMAEALDGLFQGDATRTPQAESEVSYVPKLMRADGEIDWTISAEQLERRIRAYDPWPGTSTFYRESQGRQRGRKRRLKIFAPVEVVDQSGRPGEILDVSDGLLVACGCGSIKIGPLQPDGARRMSSADFSLSGRLGRGDFLGSEEAQDVE